ncbi:MAG: ORF6N domain-containing protein [Elusimicrobiota bacterium]
MGLPVGPETIERRILLIRGHRVMLDEDLADIYGVSTKRLNQQAGRNSARFPSDFRFQLYANEVQSLRLQFATSKIGRGGRRYRPYVFTEHGAVMLASVLNTPIAVRASVQIARAFVRLRRIIGAHKELARKLKDLEKRVGNHDEKIGLLFDAIRDLMEPGDEPPRRIGFKPG